MIAECTPNCFFENKKYHRESKEKNSIFADELFFFPEIYNFLVKKSFRLIFSLKIYASIFLFKIDT